MRAKEIAILVCAGVVGCGGGSSDLEARVAELETQVADLESTVTTYQGLLDEYLPEFANLEGRIDALATVIGSWENEKGTDLAEFVARIEEANDLLDSVAVDGTDVVFSGVNVHVRSGTGKTDDDGDLTGLGNLIIGYNVDGSKADDRSGSHNIVVGDYHTYSGYSGIVTGSDNTISANNNAAVGGYQNTASGPSAATFGGNDNVAAGSSDVVLGGYESETSSENGHSLVAGGRGNYASGISATVVGGYLNSATEQWASVFGGRSNEASGQAAVVVGGREGTASGVTSTVAGGLTGDCDSENGTSVDGDDC
jgi:hypothetical protein